MMTEQQMMNVLQQFADAFRDEINKLTVEVSDLKNKVNMMKATAGVVMSSETQTVFQPQSAPAHAVEAAPQLRAAATAPASHPRTGDYRPGSAEVSIEKWFYSGGMR